MSPFDALLGIALGIGLSTACGLRVFIPPLGMNVAALTGHFPLTESFAWIGTPMVTAILGVAALVEVGAYYIPWLDNLLDTLAGPLAVGAGTLLTAVSLGDAPPFMQWTLALIAGGGSAGAVQGGTMLLRGASTATTGGSGNFLVSTGETGSALLLTVLALVVPVAAVGLIAVLAVYLYRRMRRKQRM